MISYIYIYIHILNIYIMYDAVYWTSDIWKLHAHDHVYFFTLSYVLFHVTAQETLHESIAYIFVRLSLRTYGRILETCIHELINHEASLGRVKTDFEFCRLIPIFTLLHVTPLHPGWWFGTFFIFPFSWECYHPNWRSYFWEGLVYHQPVYIYIYRLSIDYTCINHR